jgi:adenylate kinase
MLEATVTVIGPPAAGKTTLTMLVGQAPGRRIFRLRDHVPQAILAATATSADRLGWIDDVTVTIALRGYLQTAADDPATSVVLFDNFPGSGQQAAIFLSAIGTLAPGCVVHVAELAAGQAVLTRRTRGRRVCHRCEQDPIRDPRLPAVPDPADPRRCAACGNVLQPRRSDAPRLFQARLRRYEQLADGIRDTFTSAGIAVLRLDSTRPPEQLASELSTFLNSKEHPHVTG